MQNVVTVCAHVGNSKTFWEAWVPPLGIGAWLGWGPAPWDWA